MTNKTQNLFYILHEGALQEEPEPKSWEDIEVMCRLGQLSAESLIWDPEANSWKKVIDTELAPLVESQAPAVEDSGPDPAVIAEKTDAYNLLKRRIEAEPDDWELVLQAAELALALGDRPAAVRHFQRALEIRPFKARIVREAKRNLSSDERKTLRFFSRPEPVWDDAGVLVTYPLARGPLYLAIPAAVVFALTWIPGMLFVVGPLLYLWLTQVTATTARGEAQPPLWHGVLADPMSGLIKPLLVALIVAAELYLPFIILAKILTLTGSGVEVGTLALIQKSPLMIVTMSTLTVVYMPAVFVLMGVSGFDVARVANPRHVVSAVIKMEGEYVASVAIIAALLAVWGIAAFVSGFIPVVGRMVAAAVGVFVLLPSGLVVGRLQSRFSEELTHLARHG
ncbi:MAG: hypothetical protein OEN01_07900 [Candidatus Krumholzibacteria bacterium]|nr:hypothetical protein [Candidatus Krumholzibacteria bacterium]